MNPLTAPVAQERINDMRRAAARFRDAGPAKRRARRRARRVRRRDGT